MIRKIVMINNLKCGVYMSMDKSLSYDVYRAYSLSPNVLAVADVYEGETVILYYTNNKQTMLGINDMIELANKKKKIVTIGKSIQGTLYKNRLRFYKTLFFKENIKFVIEKGIKENLITECDIPEALKNTDLADIRDTGYSTLFFRCMGKHVINQIEMMDMCDKIYNNIKDDLHSPSFRKVDVKGLNMVYELSLVCNQINKECGLNIHNKLLDLFYYIIFNRTYNRELDISLLLKLCKCRESLAVVFKDYTKRNIELLENFMMNKDKLQYSFEFKSLKDLKGYEVWHNKKYNCPYKIFIDPKLDGGYLDYIDYSFDSVYPIYIREIKRYVMVYQIFGVKRYERFLKYAKQEGVGITTKQLEECVYNAFNSKTNLMETHLAETIVQLGQENKISYNLLADGTNKLFTNLYSLIRRIPLNRIGFKNNKLCVKLEGAYKCETLPTVIRYEKGKLNTIIMMNVTKFRYINKMISMITEIDDYNNSYAIVNNLKRVIRDYENNEKLSDTTKQIYYDTIQHHLEILNSRKLEPKDVEYLEKINNKYKPQVMLNEKVN